MNGFAPFEWIAAIRFLREGRQQTLFIVVGIAIGVAVIVFMSGMLAGMQANLIKRVLTSQAHIVLTVPDEIARPQRADAPGLAVAATLQRPAQRVRSIDQWQKITAELPRWPGITHASAVMTISALTARGQASRPVTLSGIDPDSYFAIIDVPSYIVAGAPRLTADDIVIGTDLAEQLGVALNDRITVAAATGATRVLTITGIFDFGNKGANQRTTFAALRTAQALSGLIGGVTEIDVTVEDVYAADVIAQAIQGTGSVRADSWIKTNAQLFSVVSAQQIAITMIRIFVGLSVAFGIASVLAVSVIQRSKDIGILRAMGASRARILRVFLLQGGLLGFAGALAGAALGGAGIVLWHDHMRLADGGEMFPLVIGPSLFIGAVLLASLTGVIAAAVPAQRAAKLDPVVAIRG